MEITDKIRDSYSYTATDEGNISKEHDIIVDICDTLNDKFIPGYDFSGLYVFLKEHYPGTNGGNKFFNVGGKARDNQFRRYYYQHSGLKFPQFNIALEDGNFRFGIAISFLPYNYMKEYPWDSLLLKNAFFRFSEYSEIYRSLLPGHKFYIYGKGTEFTSENSITEDLIKEGNFIFFGKMVNFADSDVTWEDVCETLNNLYPMYKYSLHSDAAISRPVRQISKQKSSILEEDIVLGTRTIQGGISIVEYNHKKIQKQLVELLSKEYPSESGYSIETEQTLSDGNRKVDVYLSRNDGFLRYYEIKCYVDLRSCIREAIGQLLEYQLWDGKDPESAELCIVTPHMLSPSGENYLKSLRRKYSMNIVYRRVRIPD